MPANPKLERNDMTHTTETRPPRAMTRQQGFSLVELAISLTLIAVLLLGAFYIVRNIRTSTVQKEFTQSSNQVMATASKYMANNRYTNAVSTDVLVGTGAGQADKLITNPSNTGLKALRSAIPGAWEDVGRECCTRTHGGDRGPYVYGNEAILYRISKVPKAYCNFVVSELARHPSVAKVTGRAWTAPTGMHAGIDAGPELAYGPALSTRNNVGYGGSSGFNSGTTTAMCANNYTEIYALLVPV
jgi:prepilin-type N-terminal cleavage/methylation domain-containing protein